MDADVVIQKGAMGMRLSDQSMKGMRCVWMLTRYGDSTTISQEIISRHTCFIMKF